MHKDQYGQLIFTENDICNLMLQDPTRKLKDVLVDKHISFNDMFVNPDELPRLIQYHIENIAVEKFDEQNQNPSALVRLSPVPY